MIRVVPAPAAVGVVLPAVAEGAVPLVRVRAGVTLGRVVLPGVAVSLLWIGRSVRFLIALVAVALIAVLPVAGLLADCR